MIGSIPSPSFNSIDIGPLSLNLYGLCIALGVVAAVWLFGRRLEQRGAGTRDDASAIGLVSVLAGVIGARLYHVATDWERFSDDLGAIPAIWEGGLGIPGGLLLGIPVGLWMSKRHGIPIAVAATCAAPAIPLAQAIGRFGNYFNQELYGRPTDLPWALEIDADRIVGGFPPGTTFHPTFLYESLWSLGLALLLLWIDRRFRPPDGQLMFMYLIGYGAGRFWVEGLRIDPADELGGLRWNQWVALFAVVGGLTALAVWPDRPRGDAPGAAESDDDESADGEPDDDEIGDADPDEPDDDEAGDVDPDEPDDDEIGDADPDGPDDDEIGDADPDEPDDDEAGDVDPNEPHHVGPGDDDADQPDEPDEPDEQGADDAVEPDEPDSDEPDADDAIEPDQPDADEAATFRRGGGARSRRRRGGARRGSAPG